MRFDIQYNSKPNEYEEELAVYQSVEYGNEQLLMRMHKKKENNEEQKESDDDGEEEEEEEYNGDDAVDNDNNNPNTSATTTTPNSHLHLFKSLNSTAEHSLSQQLTATHMQTINRLGSTLSSYHFSPSLRSNAEWIQAACKQLMDDYAVVKNEVIGDDAQRDFEVYSMVVKKHFGGRECQGRECQSRNSNSNSSKCEIMDAIHCAVLHAYERGYKLYAKEMELVMGGGDNEDDNGDDDSDSDQNHSDFSRDYQTERIRKILSERCCGRSEEEERRMKSKFFTVVMEEEEAERNADNDSNNSNSNSNSSADEVDEQKQNEESQRKQTKEIFYAFGYKFYYWERFKNKTEIDRNYNGGKDAYGVWYIAMKHQSFKAELLNAKIMIEMIDRQTEIGREWMDAQYVKEMENDSFGNYYNIAYRSPPSLPHILSILFHCNFDSLCTSFSAAFRKLHANETDEQLRQRNAEFREFGRLLAECVDCFGTILKDSNIRIFYHGVSRVMQFPSTVALLCSPTSTTTCVPVALRFSGMHGMILELENNKSRNLRFFDCSILSKYSSEEERLFFQGGYFIFLFHSSSSTQSESARLCFCYISI